MSIPTFNVLQTRWIPVIYQDGRTGKLGILPCLEHAHEIREIRDPSPIIEFGLYRLLVAFVLDALILAGKRPEVPEDLTLMLQEQLFDIRLFERYSDDCGDVFDLFHSSKPFLQCAMTDKSDKPLAGLGPTVPSGTNVGFFHHEHEEHVSLSAEEAARWLTTVAPFMTSGGAGLSPSINGAPAIYAMPKPDTLFSTIILNLPLRQQDSGAGTVAWRDQRTPGTERTQATTPEALTWRSRRIQLMPGNISDGLVRVSKMRFEKGDSTRLTWIDSNLAYRYEKDKVTPIRMREGRPLWRDAGVLALLSESAGGMGDTKVAHTRPDVVQRAFECIGGGALTIVVYGVRTDMKMKVFEWTRSTLSIPTNLGLDTRLGSIVQRELDRAEKAGDSLRWATKALYPREGAGNKRALGTISDRTERAFWQQLEPAFPELLHVFGGLPPNAVDDIDQVAAAAGPWRDAIKRIATDNFEVAAKDMDSDSDALERQVRARSRLQSSLRKVLS